MLEVEIDEGATVLWERKREKKGTVVGNWNFSEHVTLDSITTLTICI